MLKGMISSIATGLASGGTVDGDLVVTGDFKVEGAGSFAYDEIVDGTLQVNGNLTIANTSGDSQFIFNTAARSIILGSQTFIRNLNNTFQYGNTSGLTDHKFFTNTTERVTINDTGLGIGTSSPSYNLDIQNAGLTEAQIKASSSGRARLRLDAYSDIPEIYFSVSGSRKSSIFQSSNGNNLGIFGFTNQNTILSADLANDRIGIGTESPSDKLEVYGNGADTAIRIHEDAGAHKAQLHLRSGGNDVKLYTNGSDNKFHIDTESASQAFTIKSNGDIGIGTSSPSEKLHVAGNILLPLNASDTSHKLKLTATTSAEIYATGYGDLNLNGGLYNYSQSAYGTILRSASSGGREIHLEHSTNTALQGIKSTMSNFSYNAGDSGYFGFLTYGSTHTFKAIETNQIDNNTWDLMFNSRASGSDTERVRITSAGNVGIGETAPTQGLTLGSGKNLKLTGGIVYGVSQFNRNANNQSTIIYGGNNANANQDARIELYGQNSNFGKALINYGYSTASKLQFQVNGNDKIVFSGAGDVGIGTDPESGVALHIKSTTNQEPIIKLEQAENHALAGQLIFLTSGIANNNDDSGVIRFKGMNDAGTPEEIEYATIYVNHDDVSDGTEDASMFFRTQGSGSLENRLVLDGNSQISLSNNDDGTKNTIFGFNAGVSLDAGSNYNTFIGANVSDANMNDATNNTGVGYNALSALTSGDGNVSIGTESLRTLADGTMNIAIGNSALYSETGGDTTIAIGQTALYSQNVTTGVDSKNVGIGYLASYYNVTGTANISIGYEAMKGASGQSHSNNVGIGYHSLYALSTGSANVAVGAETAKALTVESGNVAIGAGAMSAVAKGSGGSQYTNHNIAIGQNTMTGGQPSSGSFEYNIAIGNNALNSTGTNPMNGAIAIGYNSLTNVTSGAGNTCVGYLSGDSLTTGANNTFIGWNTDGSANSAQDQIVIGRNFSGTANSRVHIGNVSSHIYNDFNTNATWTHSSDVRQKKEIKDDTLGLEFINDIRPVTYKHKSPSEFPKEWNAYDENDKEPMGGDKVIHGLIAQEVKQALDKQGVDTFSGWDVNPDGRQNVSFEAFVIPLIKAVQELSTELNQLKQQLKDK